jgi:23S rRNA G2069 N7-methylase RlmK/C1962 C5-methylase RlmI
MLSKNLRIVVGMMVFFLTSTHALKRLPPAACTLKGQLYMKTNPNRQNRVLREQSLPGQSRWATTKAPYANSISQKEISIPMSSLPAVPGIDAAVVLERGKAKLFQDGNPLIYGGACKGTVGDDLTAGQEVLVVESSGTCIGRGVYNPHSQYRVRLLARADEQMFSMSFDDLMRHRFRQAISVRSALGLGDQHDLQGSATSVYRLVNGEGDRLSGLIVDVIGDVVVIQSSAIWCELNKSRIERALRDSMVEASLGLPDSNMKFLWRKAASRLKQDGAAEIGLDLLFEDEKMEDAGAASDSSLIVLENGVKYSTDPFEGQKTGFYADQRANRDMIRRLSRGKSVLDTFCYTGGFSVNALLGGAVSVTAVDSSQKALDEMKRNVELNEIDPSKVSVEKADALAFMRGQIDAGKRFDVVICDPPKLAPKRSSLQKAVGKYTQINKLGMMLTESGGLLLTCTCSAAMTQQPETLRAMLHDAARKAGVEVTILSTSGAAPCHAVHPAYPQGSYLTAVLCSVTRPGSGKPAE